MWKRRLENSVLFTPTDSWSTKPASLTQHSYKPPVIWHQPQVPVLSHVLANAYYWIDKYAFCFLCLIITPCYKRLFSNILEFIAYLWSWRFYEGGGEMFRDEKWRTTKKEKSAQFPWFSLLLATLTIPKHN